MSEEWRRTSARVLAVKPLREALVPLVGVLALQLLGGGARPDRLALIGAAVAVVAIAPAALAWSRFRYRVADGRLEVEQGVLSRRRTTVPVDRVRGLAAEAPAIYRPLGLVRVRVESASGAGEDAEVVLDGLAPAELARLRGLLLGGGGPLAAAAAPAEAAAPAPADLLATVRLRDLLRAPLTGRGLLAPLGLAGAAAGFVLQSDVVRGRQAVDAAERVAADRPLAVLLVGAALLLVPVLAALGSVLVAHGFRLTAEPGRLIAERGLLTRRHVGYERQRLRGAELVESLPARLAGLAALDPLVTGVRRARGDLLPVGRRSVACALATRLVGPAPPLVAHPAGARRRRLVRAVAPPLVLAVPALALLPAWVGAALFALAALGVPLGRARYAALGHGLDERLLVVRRGALVRATVVVERDAVVGWTLRQSLLQRRAGVATAVAGTAAGTGAVPIVDASSAQIAALLAATTPSER